MIPKDRPQEKTLLLHFSSLHLLVLPLRHIYQRLFLIPVHIFAAAQVQSPWLLMIKRLRPCFPYWPQCQNINSRALQTARITPAFFSSCGSGSFAVAKTATDNICPCSSGSCARCSQGLLFSSLTVGLSPFAKC